MYQRQADSVQIITSRLTESGSSWCVSKVGLSDLITPHPPPPTLDIHGYGLSISFTGPLLFVTRARSREQLLEQLCHSGPVSTNFHPWPADCSDILEEKAKCRPRTIKLKACCIGESNSKTLDIFVADSGLIVAKVRKALQKWWTNTQIRRWYDCRISLTNLNW